MAAIFSTLCGWLLTIFTWALDGVLWLLGKAFYIPFDGILTAISAVFSAIDLSAFAASYAMDWAGLPPQLIWMINAVGIPQGLTILLSAITVRMALNLIPAEFTRI